MNLSGLKAGDWFEMREWGKGEVCRGLYIGESSGEHALAYRKGTGRGGIFTAWYRDMPIERRLSDCKGWDDPCGEAC